jgi:hypothetical protein
MSIKKLIKYCDILGETIKLNIKHKSKSKTLFGGVLTIATCCVLIGATWAMGNDIIYKNHPSTDLEDQLFKLRPTYYLDKYNFPFSFCFQDFDQNIYNIHKYFTYEIINVKTFNSDAATINTNLEYENCTYDHFPTMSVDYLAGAGVKTYQCIKDQNITLSGYWDNPSIEYLKFRIRLCNNSTDGGICAPQEEINEFMNSRLYAWNVYFQNSIINPKTYENATQYYIYDYYRNIRLSTTKTANVFIRSQEIETDIGILFESPSSEISYAYDSSDIEDSDPMPNTLMDINFYVANHKPIFHRKYIKAQTIIANIGGLAKAFLLGSYIISFIFSAIKLDTTILNKIFNFDLNEKERDSTKQLKPLSITEKFKVREDLVNNFVQRNDNEMVRNDNSYQSFNKVGQPVKDVNIGKSGSDKTISAVLPLPNKKDKNKKKLKISFFEILLRPFNICIKKNKVKFSLYKRLKNILLDCLDISNIVFKLEEFEKLKMILLNKEQLAMFQFISKDICTVNERDSLYSDISKMKQFVNNKEEMFKLIASYKRELENKEANISIVDNKLFSMLDEDIKIRLLEN